MSETDEFKIPQYSTRRLTPVDIAAHMQLLGDSLNVIAEALKQQVSLALQLFCCLIYWMQQKALSSGLIIPYRHFLLGVLYFGGSYTEGTCYVWEYQNLRIRIQVDNREFGQGADIQGVYI